MSQKYTSINWMKYAIVFMMIVLTINLKAQNKINGELGIRKIFVSRINSPDTYMSEDESYAIGLRALIGYHISNYLNINAGMGLDSYSGYFGSLTVPLIINVKYTLWGKKNGLFLITEGGPQLKLAQTTDSGYMIMGGIGYKFKLSRLIRLNLMTGYNYHQSKEIFMNEKYNIYHSGFFFGTSISL